MNHRALQDIFAARRSAFLFLGFMALLALGGYLYLDQWQRPRLEQAQVEWFRKRDALATGETVADATRYRNGVRDLEELEKRLVPKKEFAAFVSRLYQTAGDNSLKLAGITYKPGIVKKNEKEKEKKASDQVAVYGVSFTVSGRYGSLKNFIADLARYRELVTIDSISLSSRKQTEEEVSLNVQMTVYLDMEGA